MTEIYFTARLHSLVPASGLEVAGTTVRESLDVVFDSYPRARSYVLDEQRALRKHVCIFLNGERLANAGALDAKVTPDCEIYVMQALSGG